MKKRGLLILFITCSLFSTFAQPSLFKTGDRVCFVGNSITNNGEFHHNIFLYQQTRFPKERVSFYNCGISGDVCGGVLKRMDDDILIHQPTHVVLMLGMNDVNRGLYSLTQLTPVAEGEVTAKKEEAIKNYKIRLDSIIHIFLSKGIKVILQKPTIYDQTAAIKSENHFGVNDALKRCADYIQTLADKYQLPVIDYWTILNRINTKLQKKDSSATITGPDRVHPGSTGHLIMAYQYLKTMGMPQYISQIIVEKDEKISNNESRNCMVTSLEKSNTGISFKVKEDALPFPTVETQKQGLELVPFVEDLNVEELTLKNLPKGNYRLIIDTAIIATFSSDELKKGINLTLFRNTPQYEQAVKVREILTTLWKEEANLRTIKLMEYNEEFKKIPNKQNLDSIKNFLGPIFKKNETPFIGKQLDNYIKYKPNEAEIIRDTEALRRKAYDAAQPMEHTFKVAALL